MTRHFFLLAALINFSTLAQAQNMGAAVSRSASPTRVAPAGAASTEMLVTPRATTAIAQNLGLEPTAINARIRASIEPYRGPQLNSSRIAQTVEAVAIGLQSAKESATPKLIVLSATQRVAAERLLRLGAVAAAVDTEVARKVIQMVAHGFARNVMGGRVAGGVVGDTPDRAAFQISTLAARIMGPENMSLTPSQFDRNANDAFHAQVVQPGTDKPVSGVMDEALAASDCFG